MVPPSAVFALLAISLGLAAFACGSPTEPNTDRVVGRIDPSLSVRPVLAAPSQVRAGVPFAVTVTTVGFGCTIAEGGAVQVSQGLARLVPYDRVPGAGHDALCVERVITLLPRDLQVTLPYAGAARLRVVGFSASTPEEVMDSVEVEVTVTP